jgi:hypothetical protein
MLLRRHKNQENKSEAVAENAAASSVSAPVNAENTPEKVAELKKRKSKSKE